MDLKIEIMVTWQEEGMYLHQKLSQYTLLLLSPHLKI